MRKPKITLTSPREWSCNCVAVVSFANGISDIQVTPRHPSMPPPLPTNTHPPFPSSSSPLSSYCGFRQRGTRKSGWQSVGSAWARSALHGPSPWWPPSTWRFSTCPPRCRLQERRDGQAYCCDRGVTIVQQVCVSVRQPLHSISLIDFIHAKVFSVWFSSSDRSAMGRVSVSCMNRHITVVTVRIQRLRASRAGRAFRVRACKMRLGRGVMNGTELAMLDWKWAAAT